MKEGEEEAIDSSDKEELSDDDDELVLDESVLETPPPLPDFRCLSIAFPSWDVSLSSVTEEWFQLSFSECSDVSVLLSEPDCVPSCSLFLIPLVPLLTPPGRFPSFGVSADISLYISPFSLASSSEAELCAAKCVVLW